MTEPRLLVFFARVGDLVMLVPLLRHIAAQGGVELLARPWAKTLLSGQTWLKDIHCLERPNLPGWQDFFMGSARRQLGDELRQRHFQEILIFSGEKPEVRRWIDSWRGTTPVRELSLSGAGSSQHMVDVYRRAASEAGWESADFPVVPILDVSPEQRAVAAAQLAPIGQRVLAIQAGSSLTHRWIRRQINVKGLTPEQWGRWLARLMQRGAIDSVILLGSRQERREAQAIIAAMDVIRRPSVHDWTGRIGLGELPALFTACVATISVDTGPGHIAAAVGCPLISIFGPTNPAVFLPRGPGRIELLLGSAPCQFCHWTPLFKTCKNNVCLSALRDPALDFVWDRLSFERQKNPAQASLVAGASAG